MKTGTGLKYLFPFSLFQYVLGIKIKNMCPFAELFVYDAVTELGELSAANAGTVIWRFGGLDHFCEYTSTGGG